MNPPGSPPRRIFVLAPGSIAGSAAFAVDEFLVRNRVSRGSNKLLKMGERPRIMKAGGPHSDLCRGGAGLTSRPPGEICLMAFVPNK
jgi:hypothetical protein